MKFVPLVFCVSLSWSCAEEPENVRTTGIELDGGETILPRTGQWYYDVWEWTAHECGVSEEDLPIDSYDGFKIPVSEDNWFEIDLDDDISSICKTTGNEFLCERVTSSSSYSDGLVELKVDMLTEGLTRHESFIVGHHQLTLACIGDGCGAIESLYDMEFPCNAGIDFNSFHE